MPYKDKEKQKEAQRQHYRDNKDKYASANRRARDKKFKLLQEIKKNPCTDCGNKYNPWIMQFDHVADDKVADIRWLMRYRSWQAVLDEIHKCELVCANCHAERTYQRFIQSGQIGHYDPA